jgi:hypothetical protein
MVDAEAPAVGRVGIGESARWRGRGAIHDLLADRAS